MACNVASKTETTYNLFVEMFRRSFLAEPTLFHRILKVMFDHQLPVGPVITNNFDGLQTRAGIEKELFVRRFEETHIIPDVSFDPAAKSLIVVGSHADRRKVQAAARKKGLKIIYIDPEVFLLQTVFIHTR